MSLGRVIADTILSVSGQAASRNDTLETLTPMATKLDDMTCYCRPLLERYKFISFIETKQTKLRGTGILGRALTTVRCYFYLVSYLFGDGSNVEQFMVDRKSAILGLCTTREAQVAVEADHSQICKFSGDADSAYRGVSDRIAAMIREAIQSRQRPVSSPDGHPDYLPTP